MSTSFSRQLADALKSDRSFMDLLRQGAQPRKSRIEGWRKQDDADAGIDFMIREDFFFPAHPDVDTLYDYILGTLTNEQIREVMDHLSACEECARNASEIRRLDKEITKDFKEFMRTSRSEPKDPSSDDSV